MPRKELNGGLVAIVTIALFAVGLALAAGGGALGARDRSGPTAIESDRPVDSLTATEPVAPTGAVIPSEGPAGSNGGKRELIRPGVRDEGDPEQADNADDRSDMMLLTGGDVCCAQGNIPGMDRVRDEA